NIRVEAKADIHLIIGPHTVADIYCGDCGELLIGNMSELMRHRRSTR
ncbi:hypothetical protein Golob_024515, partial [Gossypium lobatum]|nr:hypothetical protein [Gossypium lobatum]